MTQSIRAALSIASQGALRGYVVSAALVTILGEMFEAFILLLAQQQKQQQQQQRGSGKSGYIGNGNGSGNGMDGEYDNDVGPAVALTDGRTDGLRSSVEKSLPALQQIVSLSLEAIAQVLFGFNNIAMMLRLCGLMGILESYCHVDLYCKSKLQKHRN